MRVYKVLDNYAGKLTSVGTIYPHEITYHPSRPTWHINMFVFESVEAVRQWINRGRDKAILWECETTQAKPAPHLILKAHYVNQHFDEYWEGVAHGEQWSKDPKWPEWLADALKRPPEGTLLVDDLKLIQEVSDPERSSTRRVTL